MFVEFGELCGYGIGGGYGVVELCGYRWMNDLPLLGCGLWAVR